LNRTTSGSAVCRKTSPIISKLRALRRHFSHDIGFSGLDLCDNQACVYQREYFIGHIFLQRRGFKFLAG
jgi:hypothetical protein